MFYSGISTLSLSCIDTHHAVDHCAELGWQLLLHLLVPCLVAKDHPRIFVLGSGKLIPQDRLSVEIPSHGKAAVEGSGVEEVSIESHGLRAGLSFTAQVHIQI